MSKLITAAIISAASVASFAAPKAVNPNFNAGAVNSNVKPVAQMKRAFINVHIPSLFIGALSGTFDYALNRTWAVGLRGMYFAFGGKAALAKAYAFGAEAQYALSHDLGTDGWLVNPYISYMHLSATSNLNGQGVSQPVGATSAYMIGSNLNYQWMWNSGINVRLGLGVFWLSKKTDFGIGNSNIHPDLNFTLGYAFG